MEFKFNDGGRAAAGYKGTTGDCIVRAFAIATGKPYQKVYDAINQMVKVSPNTKRKKNASARNGVGKNIYKTYIESLGWIWVPCMTIGSGCKVHLKSDELPRGILIARVSKHLTTVIDHVINDIYDPSRDGQRCVYGYWVERKKNV